MDTTKSPYFDGKDFGKTFTLKSNELGGQLTNKQYFKGFGYEGENLSPQLYWENPPEGTQSFALTMIDLDTPTGSGFWHWIVYNIPADARELVSGAGDPGKSLLPAGAIHGNTDMGVPGFVGAAPNDGPPHRYQITLIALNTVLDVDKNIMPAFLGLNLHFATIERASILLYAQKK